jgi:hypothetical protein
LKNEVSKARKEGYMQSHKWYARKPCKHCRSKNGQRVAGNQTYGKELTEEELLKEHNQNKQLTQILIINF